MDAIMQLADWYKSPEGNAEYVGLEEEATIQDKIFDFSDCIYVLLAFSLLGIVYRYARLSVRIMVR